MSDESKQLIVAALVLLAQSYATDPTRYPIFAWFWDFIARITGYLANWLGFVSMNARYNYYMVVNSGD